jgi:CRISPR/Cas system-associated exonuclease Cas4 (RecB family)
MALPSDFQFNQSNLQDFVDCRRRFQLRHLFKVAWPGVEVEPALEHERRIRRGADFHRMIHQSILGIPGDRLMQGLQEPELKMWWDNFLAYGMQDLPGEVIPEVLLSTMVGEYRLVAKYDLIAFHEDGRIVIVDWKTTLKRPSRNVLMDRMQTTVYPYLLVQAGSHLAQVEGITPDQIEMVYWFAEYPKEPERFKYDLKKFQQDEDELTRIIEEIVALDEDQFYLTEREQYCTSCQYRSLCQRGVEAGPADTWSEELSPLDDLYFKEDYELRANF